MKASYLTRIAAAGIMSVAPFLSGCAANTELEMGIRLRNKGAATLDKENYSKALDKVYDPNDSLHNKSQISEKTLDKVLTSPFMQSYQNRQ